MEDYMSKKILLLLVCLLASFTTFAVNVNTASAEEIAKSLKGIGLNKAGALIIYRDKHGPFKTLQQLTKVKGIGAATIDKNRENIELETK